MDSDVLSRLLNPVTQTEKGYPHRLRSGRLRKSSVNGFKRKDTLIFRHFISDRMPAWNTLSPFFLLTNILVCKIFTRVAPLMFAVNIETNGNPHHRPWSIGKRLLSSWLPVRSAKDQGGKGHTHIVRWKPRPNGTGSHLSQSSLASMDSQPQPATGLFQIETSRTFVNVEYKNIYQR